MDRIALLTTAGGLLLLMGCHPEYLAPSSHPTSPELPIIGRGVIEPDVTAVPLEVSASPPKRPTQYRRLTVVECSSLAMKNAPLADELVAHPDNNPQFQKCVELANLSRLERGYAADEIRNRSSGEALEMYFKLAAAEGQFDLTASGDNILRTQLAAAIKAEKEGLRDRADIQAIRRQLLELESQIAKLEAVIAVLNAGLRGRLGLDPKDVLPIWPADPLRVRAQEIAVEQAVNTGLLYRPDLNLLRTLTSDESHGRKLANAVLMAVNPLLGTTDTANPLGALLAALKKNPTTSEAIIHQQLVGLLAVRERQAGAEIQAGVANIRGARAAVAAKVAEVQHLSTQVADLEKKVQAGVAGATNDLVKTRLDLLKMQGELLGAVTDWQIADVKLRQAMGMLVRE